MTSQEIVTWENTKKFIEKYSETSLKSVNSERELYEHLKDGKRLLRILLYHGLKDGKISDNTLIEKVNR